MPSKAGPSFPGQDPSWQTSANESSSQDHMFLDKWKKLETKTPGMLQDKSQLMVNVIVVLGFQSHSTPSFCSPIDTSKLYI